MEVYAGFSGAMAFFSSSRPSAVSQERGRMGSLVIFLRRLRFSSALGRSILLAAMRRGRSRKVGSYFSSSARSVL